MPRLRRGVVQCVARALAVSLGEVVLAYVLGLGMRVPLRVHPGRACRRACVCPVCAACVPSCGADRAEAGDWRPPRAPSPPLTPRPPRRTHPSLKVEAVAQAEAQVALAEEWVRAPSSRPRVNYGIALRTYPRAEACGMLGHCHSFLQ